MLAINRVFPGFRKNELLQTCILYFVFRFRPLLLLCSLFLVFHFQFIFAVMSIVYSTANTIYYHHKAEHQKKCRTFPHDFIPMGSQHNLNCLKMLCLRALGRARVLLLVLCGFLSKVKAHAIPCHIMQIYVMQTLLYMIVLDSYFRFVVCHKNSFIM